jgi:hypothetical protein
MLQTCKRSVFVIFNDSRGGKVYQTVCSNVLPSWKTWRSILFSIPKVILKCSFLLFIISWKTRKMWLLLCTYCPPVDPAQYKNIVYCVLIEFKSLVKGISIKIWGSAFYLLRGPFPSFFCIFEKFCYHTLNSVLLDWEIYDYVPYFLTYLTLKEKLILYMEISFMSENRKPLYVIVLIKDGVKVLIHVILFS